jgi:hypothetical protein
MEVGDCGVWVYYTDCGALEERHYSFGGVNVGIRVFDKVL